MTSPGGAPGHASWASAGITADIVHPGAGRHRHESGGRPYAEPQKADTTLGRFGGADEIASMAAYLAGDGAAYETGAGFAVDGGHAA
ncbi:SDR family oxidoreductase [Streptomyces sp. ISL-10]|uniref:SDR family oxidoreductase n=1 Tax=Streptomyces sp. ISL-10 TaxID=2819172 RepID=UPI002034F25E|nr:SDR family oxidoreductase [Streptomyces sp. ISL-10]